MGNGRERSGGGGRARVRWSPELGERFLALVRETGNARAAAIALGAPNAFNKRMKSDPEFRRRARAATAEADARLSGAASPFPAPAAIVPLPTDAASLGGFLRPGRKRAQLAPQPVIRRNSQGRTQVTMAREGHWTAEIEADFLARVRATGNISASARAVGFQPASVKQRMRRWPALKRAVDAALDEASDDLEYALVAHASALVRRAEEGVEGEAADVASEGSTPTLSDPIGVMRILSFIDARRARRIGRPRKGPPGKSFEDAVESILRKLDAIERHEARYGRGGEGEAQ
ncbi:MAG: hypothetical protein QOH86_1963 [Sphingomonadales bacterium]|jgi:hypothetical protein|nr:hypothetical protein [Sphingomonadales bacterium]